MINIVPMPYYVMEKCGCKILNKNSTVAVSNELKEYIDVFKNTFNFIDDKNYKYTDKK